MKNKILCKFINSSKRRKLIIIVYNIKNFIKLNQDFGWLLQIKSEKVEWI